MKDPRVEKLAEMLVSYSVPIKPGDKAMIQGSSVAAPLIREIYRQVLKAGGHPFILATIPGVEEIFFKTANDEQLEFIHEPYRYLFDTYDARFAIICDVNTKELTNIDPTRMAIARKSRRDIFNRFIERIAKKEMLWTGTLFPTQAHAQQAEMSLSDYEDFVYNACMPDMKDPVGYWKKVSAEQQKICDWLKGKKQVHVTGPETDLTLNIEGREFINCDCHENVPDGEVFTSPVEDSANGHVYFSYPAINDGHEVTGVRLWFENGKVVKATAEKNENYLISALDTDDRSRYLGEFAIGTNEGITKFTGEILFDEKIGGSFHMAVGAGIPEAGGTNQSSIHWDMVCDLRQGGEIRIDDQLIYKNGKFLLDR
ncbi:MAG: aminopeptidase [Anaerolineaceae bacterium]